MQTPRIALGIAIAAALLGAGLAGAATIPFDSTLAFRIAAGTEEHGFQVSGAGSGVAVVNGSGAGLHVSSLFVPDGAAEATGLYPYSDPESGPIHGIVVDASIASGAFAGNPLAGPMQLHGTAKVCLFGDCPNPVVNLVVPLRLVGVPGTHAVDAALPITVIGAPWTTGTASAGLLQTAGSAFGPLGALSSTAQPGGSVSLVTPTYIYSDNGLVVSMITRLKLDFVPEPGTLTLIGAGVAAIAAGARRRQTRRSVSG